MTRQTGGGSVGQSLRYVDTSAPEQSAPAGRDLLIERGLIARPAIGGGTRKRKGGFFPSVMGGVVNAGMIAAPLSAFAARKMLTQKHRRGGGKKGERWEAQREEAKAILQTYGKPTAINIQKFAVAKRKGREAADTFLDSFREKMEEKQRQKEAKQRNKEAKKLAKKAEREAKKASKKAKPKAPKKATKKKEPVRKGTHLFFNNEGRIISNSGRAPTQLQLRRQAEENARALASLAKKVRTRKAKAPAEPRTPTVNRPKTPNSAPKTKKAPSNKSRAYFEELKKARTFLASVGHPTGPNMAKFASMKLKGENTSAWLENFKTRRPVKTAKVRKTRAPAPAPPTATATKTKKAPSNKSRAYFEELKKARTFLATVGRPTGPNMSRFASMKLKGENTSAWLENFKTRRPLGATTAKAPRKTKKVLTAVREENESNNSNSSRGSRSGSNTSRSSNSNSGSSSSGSNED